MPQTMLDGRRKQNENRFAFCLHLDEIVVVGVIVEPAARATPQAALRGHTSEPASFVGASMSPER